MRADPLDQLTAENPVPEMLPALPLEVIRQRLDFEPPVPPTRNRRRRRALDLGPMTFSLAGGAMAVIALLVVISLPSDGLSGFSLAYAKAAIRQGERTLSSSGRSVRYTEALLTSSRPPQPTRHVIQRFWMAKGAWRVSSTMPSGPGRRGFTDAAFLGGITEYYVPYRHTLYVNRPRYKASVNGGLPSSNPVELGLEAILNLEPPNASAHASSFKDTVLQLMAFHGAHITRSRGLLSVSVTRAGHSSRVIARLGSYQPVLISLTRPGPRGTHVKYIGTERFVVYRRPLPAAAAAKALDLLRIYPHAKVVILHHNTLNLP